MRNEMCGIRCFVCATVFLVIAAALPSTALADELTLLGDPVTLADLLANPALSIRAGDKVFSRFREYFSNGGFFNGRTTAITVTPKEDGFGPGLIFTSGVNGFSTVSANEDFSAQWVYDVDVIGTSLIKDASQDLTGLKIKT